MNTTVSHVILRKAEVKRDWRLAVEPKSENNGGKHFVNEIYPKIEKSIDNPEWRPVKQKGKTPVLETGYGGVEISTFTEKAGQDRHKHFISTEIYTVIEGTMTIRIEDKDNVVLEAGDEIIMLPGVIHKVLESRTPFLTRVHAINCYGLSDKYTEENGVWCQALTFKSHKEAADSR